MNTPQQPNFDDFWNSEPVDVFYTPTQISLDALAERGEKITVDSIVAETIKQDEFLVDLFLPPVLIIEYYREYVVANIEKFTSV